MDSKRNRTRGANALAWLGLMIASGAGASAPDVPVAAQIRQALAAAAAGVAKPAPEVDAVDGCFPGVGERDWAVCSVRLRDAPRGVEMAFHRAPEGWWEYADRSDLYPACPEGAAADALLRTVVHFPNLEVNDFPSEGILTDQRGLLRDRKGPLRLGCTYGVSSDRGDYTVLAYFSYIDGRYEIDPDKELLSDD